MFKKLISSFRVPYSAVYADMKQRYNRYSPIYTVSQKKTRHSTHVDNFVKYWSIFKIFSLLD